MTTFTGANGQGKTNLVEAAAYVATFGSHRVATDAPLIRHGAERAILRAVITSAGRDSLVEIEINPGRANRVRLNRVAGAAAARGHSACCAACCSRPRTWPWSRATRTSGAGTSTTCWSPPAAVRRGPGRLRAGAAAARRAAEVGPGAGRRVPPSALEVWDDHLVAAGRGAHRAAGCELVGRDPAAGGQRLRGRVRRGAGAAIGLPPGGLAGSTAADAVPGAGPRATPRPRQAEPRPSLASGMREALERSARRAELDRGVCLVGPHRDELELQHRRAARARLRQPRRVLVAGARAPAGRLSSCCARAARIRC